MIWIGICVQLGTSISLVYSLLRTLWDFATIYFRILYAENHRVVIHSVARMVNVYPYVEL